MKIPNYKIIKEIGAGGMGSVYLAEHSLIGHKVAIKSLHVNMVNNQELKVRFKEEAKTLAKMNHPGIVGLRDYIEQQDGIFLIMEYVEGNTLDKYISEVTGPIVEEKLIDLFIQILEAFDYAHKNKIVHRDIKPANIIIDKEKKIKILDFGIAKILEETKSFTKTGTQIGTVYFMSPEQVTGDKNIDHRSDIYSLGVTLFQMATGECPYDPTQSEYHIFNKIVKEPLPNPNSIYPGVSIKIQSLITKATAKNPDERYQSCKEFIKAIKSKTIDENPINSTGIDTVIKPLKAPKPPEKKYRKKVILISILLIGILASGITFFFKPSSATNVLYKQQITHNTKSYTVFVVSATGENIRKFTVLENENKVPHSELIEKLRKTNYSFLYNTQSNFLLDTLNNDSLFFMTSDPTNFGIVNDSCSHDGLVINNSKTLNFVSKASDSTGLLIFLDNEAKIINNNDFENNNSVRLAIESGPLLISNQVIKSSSNDTLKKADRVGVGSFTDISGQKCLVFVTTNEVTTLFEFSEFFKSNFDCEQAMCLGNYERLFAISNLELANDKNNQIACRYLVYNELFKENSNKLTNPLALFKPKPKAKPKPKPTTSNRPSNTIQPIKSVQPTPSIQPNDVVNMFLNALDSGNFIKAFNLQNKWSNKQTFINGYGGTEAVIINSVWVDKINGNEASVNAKYVSFDPTNVDMEVYQQFRLRNINGKWIITAIKNITPPKRI